MTDRQRQAKRREKIKVSDSFQDYKKKNVEYQTKCRAKKKQLESKLPVVELKRLLTERRQKVKERVAKCRLLKTLRQKRKDTGSPRPYNSAKALGKALSRARNAMEQALPRTPRRKNAVRRELFRQAVLKSQNVEMSQKLEPRTSAVSCNTKDLVREFYDRDDVSQQAPGRKDALSIKGDDGIKQKVQVRYLTSSLMEVYALFKSDHSGVKIGKSKFAELRPKHVLLSNKIPHNVCLCKYHENFISAAEALHKCCASFPRYSQDLPGKLVCNPGNRQCWFNQCEKCKDGKRLVELLNELESQMVTWFVWKNDKDGRLCKTVEEGTSGDLVTYIVAIFPHFIEHCYVKRQQAAAHKQQREEILSSADSALVQIDFSENYTCVQQDEIQSAHWQQKQVSLFTAAVWHSGKLHPIVLVSDNLSHAKDTVIAYVSSVLQQLSQSVKNVNIWSDGPASQFKNRYVAAAIQALQKKHCFDIKWNFFATSHGKGPVDGIGGSVKRQVWSAVKSRRHRVTDAASFLLAAKSTNVDVQHMTEDMIAKINKTLNTEELFAGAENINGIASFHKIVVKDGKIHGFQLTADVDTEDNSAAVPTSDNKHNGEAEESGFKTGDWCVVEYDGSLYPGDLLYLLFVT